MEVWSIPLFEAALFDWQSFKQALPQDWPTFVDRFEIWRKSAEPITWIVGGVLALIPVAFAIRKWIYFRYTRLPARLEEMLRIEEKRLKDTRRQLRQTIDRPTPFKSVDVPIFPVGPLQKAMKELRWTSWWHWWGHALPTADKSLNDAIKELDHQTRLVEEKKNSYENQQATAFLLKGAIACANASRKREAKLDDSEEARTALNYFLKALEIDRTDIEALEYAAHQHRAVGELSEAQEKYERLSELCIGNDNDMSYLRSRALGWSGEMLNKLPSERGRVSRWDKAKAQLEKAIKNLPIVRKQGIDHGHMLSTLASVEFSRGTKTLPGQCCDEAIRIFQDLLLSKRDLAEASAALTIAQELRTKIRQGIEQQPEGLN